MQLTTVLAAALLLVSVLVVVNVLTKRGRASTAVYELLPGLLSQGERAFYRALLAAVSEHYVIAPKVRVADVLRVAPSGQLKGQTASFNKIAMKHFDFVLCDPRTLAFVGAVELDDETHNRRDRVARDKFLDDAAAAVKLPLYRFPAKATYVVAEIRDALLIRPIASDFAPRAANGRIEPTL